MFSKGKFKATDEGLPVIVSGVQNIEPRDLVEELIKGYIKYYGSQPSLEQRNAWMGLASALSEESISTDESMLLELPLLNGASRIDILIPGTNKTIIVEAKSEDTIDYNVIKEACLQAETYVKQLIYLHESPFSIDVVESWVYMYRIPDHHLLRVDAPCNVVGKGGFHRLLRDLKPMASEDVEILASNLRPDVTKSSIFARILKGVRYSDLLSSLYRTGIAPTETQREIIKLALNLASSEGPKSAIIVEGGSGSGKTITALLLLFEALNSGKSAFLGYINNRLVKYIKRWLPEKIEGAEPPIWFSVVGKQWLKRRGICEHPSSFIPSSGLLDLLILDEAQRIPEKALRNCMEVPAKVVVVLVDTLQALLPNETSDASSIKTAAQRSNRRIHEYKLPPGGRVPPHHIRAVQSILELKPPKEKPLIRIYDSYLDFREALLDYHRRGHKVAQICSFTESKGISKRPRSLSWSEPENIRIGYPLPSGFDLYKGLNIKVKWLMDPDEEYAYYWKGDFGSLSRIYCKRGNAPWFCAKRATPVDCCASVYGAQGFEAEYVGVVWGRDLICRKSPLTGEYVFQVNPDPITDYIGCDHSGKKGNCLMRLARTSPARAIDYLKRRYFILLTRSTRETLVFFEDPETKKCIENLLTHS